MANNSELLANIFQAVTNTLVENKQVLNQADDQNHDHGTNMVKTFQAISNSIENKKESPASDALAYAASQVSKEATSGSGKLYAQNLATAANQFKGQAIDPQAAVQLLQTLIGGGQTAQQMTQSGKEQQNTQSTGGDLLGSLLGGLTGSGESTQQPTESTGGDLLGSLLGGLTGSGSSQATANSSANANSGLDLGDLLNAGMAFMQAKQSGGSTGSALLQAVLAGSGMGTSNHRQQSTQLVANSFLQALGALTGSKA